MKRHRRFLVFVPLLLLLTLGASLYRADIPLEELKPRYTDAHSQFVEFDGQLVHFRDQGTGPPLLLLHGTASSLQTWDGWVEVLQDRFRLIRLDLPAFGLSGPPSQEAHGIEHPLDILDDLLDHLEIPKVAIAGNSLGGFIAWRYTAHRPQRVTQLILIDAAGYPFDRDPKKGQGSVFNLGRVPVLGPLLTRFTPRFLVEKGLQQVYADDSKITAELIDRHYELLLREGNREALLQGLQDRRNPQHELIPSIRQPTLLLWGEEDHWIPPSIGERFHQDLPDSELVVYESVGHAPMEETPRRTAEDAAEFLQRRAAVPAF